MSITPDTKNWTWVLERPCPECGFEVDSFARDDIGALIRENMRAWQRVLGAGAVGVRPRPDMWSPLEYGCHVRDVYRVMTGRVQLMLSADDPAFANWDQDETAETDAYSAQDPAVVAVEVGETGTVFAECFAGLSAEEWARPGRRSDGSCFTVESIARYAVHDLVHHLVDVPAV